MFAPRVGPELRKSRDLANGERGHRGHRCTGHCARFRAVESNQPGAPFRDAVDIVASNVANRPVVVACEARVGGADR